MPLFKCAMANILLGWGGAHEETTSAHDIAVGEVGPESTHNDTEVQMYTLHFACKNISALQFERLEPSN